MKNIVNIINFIRAVEPRHEIDLYKPLAEQIRVMKQHGLKGTFLAQYDTLCDKKMVELLRDIPQGSEIGIWLETVQPQVEAAGLEWRGRYPWDWHNDVGFLIGYEPEERKHLIDVHMDKFKELFGFYPTAVGSWHLDAFSMAYLHEKYKISAACICRDQVGTDGYTIQGGYYNQAYYPSVFNMLSPAQTKENQIDMPVFKMLGSCPAFAYDYQLFEYDGIGRMIPTLEPVWHASGSEWSDHLFNEILSENGIEFNYTQIGQENSFGWEAMAQGIEYQFAKAAELSKIGKLDIMTLSKSGEWFKSKFELTPATTLTSQNNWKNNNVKSYWYESRFYRINLFLENNILRVRDMYIFNEKYKEKYLQKRCATHSCEYRNLPIFDGALYSDKDKKIKAGVYFCKNGEKIVWDKIEYFEKDKAANLILDFKGETVEIKLTENEIFIKSSIKNLCLIPVFSKENVYGKFIDNEAFDNCNGNVYLTYIEKACTNGNKIEFIFDGFDYKIEVEGGKINTDFSLTPIDGILKIKT